jgi:hypothetical protein
MSFPAAAISATAQQAVAAMNPLDTLMASVNSNPYFIGLMMLSLNLGGRFLGLEISKDQEKFLSQPWVRRFFLFAVLFVATRNVIIAAGVAIIVILCLGYLFNENSSLCLWKCAVQPLPAEGEGMEKKEAFTGRGLSPDEQQMLRRLLDKQAAAVSDETTGDEKSGESKRLAIETYVKNMSLLR